MADHRHEGGLGLVRGLGIVLGLFGMPPCIQQALLGFLLCGHIGHRADPDRPSLVARGGHDGLQVARGALLIRGGRVEQLPVYLAVNALHQAADQHVHQVAGGVADQLLQCLVMQDQLPVLLVEQAQADRRGFDQGAAQRFAFMHPCGFLQRRPQHAPVDQQQQRPQRGQQRCQGQPTAEQIDPLRRPDVAPAVESQQRPVDAMQWRGHHEGTAVRPCLRGGPGRRHGLRRRTRNRAVRSAAQNVVSAPVDHLPHARAGLLQPLTQALQRFKRQPVDEGDAVAAQAHLGDQRILTGERIAPEVGAQPAAIQLKLGVRTRRLPARIGGLGQRGQRLFTGLHLQGLQQLRFIVQPGNRKQASFRFEGEGDQRGGRILRRHGGGHVRRIGLHHAQVRRFRLGRESPFARRQCQPGDRQRAGRHDACGALLGREVLADRHAAGHQCGLLGSPQRGIGVQAGHVGPPALADVAIHCLLAAP
ncbi:hypothetical protein D3C72_1090700 [compost metagenome]